MLLLSLMKRLSISFPALAGQQGLGGSRGVAWRKTFSGALGWTGHISIAQITGRTLYQIMV
jgi:hypothetical protein